MEQITMPALHYFRNFIQTIADNNAKTRLIVVASDDKDVVKQTIEKIAHSKGQFTAKFINKSVSKNYQVIDNKEVWIATQQKTEIGYPCILWTNDQNIVDAYKENFKKTWNHPRAITVYQSSIMKEFVPQINGETLMPNSLSS